MVTVDKAIIARLKQGKEHFEVLVDCDNALLLKQGKPIDMKDVLADEKVFSDAKKGLLASGTRVKSVFGTDDVAAVARKIIKEGEVQLTAEHKARLFKEKKRRILEYIHSNGVDPKTKLPHPLSRIELAFEEAKIHIDEHKDEMQQVEAILKKLRPILPISFDSSQFSVIVPTQYGGKVHAVLRGVARVVKEEWGGQGEWMGTVEVPAAKRTDLFDKLGHLTHGEVQITEL